MGFSCGGRSPFCVQRMHLRKYNLMVASCKSGRWNRNQLREISRTPRVSSRRPRNTFLPYEYDLCLVNLLWLIGVIGAAGHAWFFTRMMRVEKRRGFWRLRWSMKYILGYFLRIMNMKNWWKLFSKLLFIYISRSSNNNRLFHTGKKVGKEEQRSLDMKNTCLNS